MSKLTQFEKFEAKTVSRASIKNAPYNPRRISDTARKRLKEKIAKDGMVQPLIWNENTGNLVGGHQRLSILDELEENQDYRITVAVVKVSEKKEKELNVFLNNTCAMGEWNPESLNSLLAEFEGELDSLGFDESDLEKILGKIENEFQADPDDTPDVQQDAVSALGDVWVMGKHRLVCGDSTVVETVKVALNGTEPNLMVTDPPYGVNYDPTWRDEAGGKFGNGKAKMRGKVDNDDKCDWSDVWALFHGDVAYVWHSALHACSVAKSLQDNDFIIRSQIIWRKQHFAMSRGDYHWMHEPCWYAVRKGKTGHWNGDRKQTTIWDIGCLNPCGRVKNDADIKSSHGTQKPVECMKRPIENNSKKGDSIYEPFSGSGTTIIACEMTGRHCNAIELNPAYVDLAVRRWQNFTGQKAIHEVSGKSFDEMEK